MVASPYDHENRGGPRAVGIPRPPLNRERGGAGRTRGSVPPTENHRQWRSGPDNILGRNNCLGSANGTYPKAAGMNTSIVVYGSTDMSPPI
jgi:hypothetical protein